MNPETNASAARATRYLFEGEMLTASEIKKFVPALSVHTIANHVREGRTTRKAMLTYNRAAAQAAGARKGRATGRARGLYSPIRKLNK